MADFFLNCSSLHFGNAIGNNILSVKLGGLQKLGGSALISSAN